MRLQPAALALVVSVVGTAAFGGDDALAPAEVPSWLQSNAAARLLDVRTADEYARERIAGALHISVGDLEGRLEELPDDADWVVYCERGGRADRAVELLRASGYRARVIRGSLSAWREAGLPVER